MAKAGETVLGDSGRLSRKLAFVLRADVVVSTRLVRHDETVARERFPDSFSRVSQVVDQYGGIAHEVPGDALIADLSRASDAVCTALTSRDNNSTNCHLSPVLDRLR